MKRVTFTVEELKTQAIKAMENCMAYITVGDIKLAIVYYGEASVWEGLLEDLNIYLDEEDEHYAAMLEIYHEQSPNWKF